MKWQYITVYNKTFEMENFCDNSIDYVGKTFVVCPWSPILVYYS